MPLPEHLVNRKWLADKLRAEVVGPDPAGPAEEMRIDGEPRKFAWEDFRKPRRQLNGEEILSQDPPTKRYGAGILYPVGVEELAEQTRSQDESQSDPVNEPDKTQNVDEKLEQLAEKKASKSRVSMDDSEDYAVTLANAYRPSAIGLSFLADLSQQSTGFRVELVNVGRLGNNELSESHVGSYRQVAALAGDPGGQQYPRTVWLRVPIVTEDGKCPYIDISRNELEQSNGPIRKHLDGSAIGLEIVVVVRGGYAQIGKTQRLITVSLVNRREIDAGKLDELCIFQSGLRVSGLNESNWIFPYPDVEISESIGINPLSDECVNRLLYRQYQTFAIGHGCSADWAGDMPDAVSQVWTDVLPAFETPSTSADLFVQSENGDRLQVQASMRKLGGLDPVDDGFNDIQTLVNAYEKWIVELKSEREGIRTIPPEMQGTADGLIERCENCLARIRDGVALLNETSKTALLAREAFRLANQSMLIAQLRSTRDVRKPVIQENGGISWVPPISEPDPAIPHSQRGYWRAFQIAFLLMSLRGITEPDSIERETVDLIWFPTGGGKTEAYLGLTAFTIFYNRLSGQNPGGADVLMRYTLRLLTAQQFQRAALLFCAMESLRKKDKSLGNKPFRIGLWVGGSATPNTRQDACYALGDLEKNSESENPFVLLKCPWCGAAFGSVMGSEESKGGKYKKKSKAEIPSLFGYRLHKPSPKAQKTVVFRCGDPACDYGEREFEGHSAPLPIVIIDEDLLEDPPNLVIGTVDKFAMLAWKPEVRRLFGIGEDGRHIGLPPSLIIQDELHLISGPLGSMVGAYETLIERLCRKNGDGEIKPKIIASTATISRAPEQISHLYARDKVFLFPPAGLEANDSFFAREARNDDGTPKPGRLYLGVLAPSHGSLQTTEARVFASLMQHAATMNTDDAGRDPWWTLLCFFNSLRELGSAASLFVADTRDYLRVVLDRQGVSYEHIRKLFNVSELTSRIRGDQVPKELERLEKVYTSRLVNGKNLEAHNDMVDACLASNIIEVGVDVTRLSLMAIVGQPKTTSQYIQVSSRVGRDPEKPGMVVVLYGQSKPRDRSHYERFRPYHQQLYAQVEPTSVTPFSAPAVDRALHSLIVATVRQFGMQNTEASHPDPFPLEAGTWLRDLVENMIEERVSDVSAEEHDQVMKKFQKRLEEWKVWQPGEYGGFGAAPQDPPLLHPAGSSEPSSWDGRSWPTMSSLRNVDASCEAEVTSFFNRIREE